MRLQTDKWISLGIKAAGAAFSSTVLSYIKGAIPAIGVSDDILTIIVGFVLDSGWIIKNKMVQDFGEGMLLAGLSQLIASAVPQAAGSFAHAGQQAPNSVKQAAAQAAVMRSRQPLIVGM